jgi:hypothetical protein
MPAGIVTNGVILRDMGETMRTFNTRRLRFLPFRLLLIVAGALLLLAALAPRANADVIAYFNFEDGTLGGPPDFVSDVVFAPDNNPGGGVVLTTMTTNYIAGDMRGAAGLLLNRTAGDIDNANPGIALGLSRTSPNNGAHFDFTVTPNTAGLLFTNMTFSFAVASAGNGFTTATIQFSTNGGGTFTTAFVSPPIAPNALTLVSGAIPAAADNAPSLIIRMVLTGGTSNGNNLESVIDNIRLDGTIVPEPTTVAGGLLGVLGLCWHQRRRLIRSVRLLRA